MRILVFLAALLLGAATASAQQPVTASMSFSSSGDNTVISATTGKAIVVYSVAMTCASPVDVTFKDGASTTLGAFQGITTMMMDPMPGPTGGWQRYLLTRSNAFIINLSSAVACKGTVWYALG